MKEEDGSETVEKVPKQILGRDAEKNDLTECARINDRTITRGHETPQKYSLFYIEGFFDSLSSMRNLLFRHLNHNIREGNKGEAIITLPFEVLFRKPRVNISWRCLPNGHE
jgi:hypothetical protein